MKYGRQITIWVKALVDRIEQFCDAPWNRWGRKQIPYRCFAQYLQMFLCAIYNFLFFRSFCSILLRETVNSFWLFPDSHCFKKHFVFDFWHFYAPFATSSKPMNVFLQFQPTLSLKDCMILGYSFELDTSWTSHHYQAYLRKIVTRSYPSCNSKLNLSDCVFCDSRTAYQWTFRRCHGLTENILKNCPYSVAPLTTISHVAGRKFSKSRNLLHFLESEKNFDCLSIRVVFFLPTSQGKFQISQKLSIRFSWNFAQSFYTQRCPCVRKGIKILWLGCEKHSQNTPKKGQKTAIFRLFFQFSQKLSIRFKRNFLQSFYTILESSRCNGIRIVSLWCEKQPKLSQKWPKTAIFRLFRFSQKLFIRFEQNFL